MSQKTKSKGGVVLYNSRIFQCECCWTISFIHTCFISQFRSKISGPHSSLQVALHSDLLFQPVTPLCPFFHLLSSFSRAGNWHITHSAPGSQESDSNLIVRKNLYKTFDHQPFLINHLHLIINTLPNNCIHKKSGVSLIILALTLLQTVISSNTHIIWRKT